jgi:hypothetical protein
MAEVDLKFQDYEEVMKQRLQKYRMIDTARQTFNQQIEDITKPTSNETVPGNWREEMRQMLTYRMAEITETLRNG